MTQEMIQTHAGARPQGWQPALIRTHGPCTFGQLLGAILQPRTLHICYHCVERQTEKSAPPAQAESLCDISGLREAVEIEFKF